VIGRPCSLPLARSPAPRTRSSGSSLTHPRPSLLAVARGRLSPPPERLAALEPSREPPGSVRKHRQRRRQLGIIADRRACVVKADAKLFPQGVNVRGGSSLELEDGTSFFEWAARRYPRDLYTVALDPWTLSPER
jgi:hypothetical protein